MELFSGKSPIAAVESFAFHPINSTLRNPSCSALRLGFTSYRGENRPKFMMHPFKAAPFAEAAFLFILIFRL
jgi:hypothetical protein